MPVHVAHEIDLGADRFRIVLGHVI